MLNALQYAAVIVDLEEADARTSGSYVDEDQRDFAFGELIEQRFFHTEGHHVRLCARAYGECSATCAWGSWLVELTRIS
jgi:hypothetical protein